MQLPIKFVLLILGQQEEIVLLWGFIFMGININYDSHNLKLPTLPNQKIIARFFLY